MSYRILAVGLVVIAVGMAMVVLGFAGRGNLSTGGFVLIGPFPIVFGTGANSGQSAALALAVGLVMLVLLSLLAWRATSGVRGSPGGNA